MKNGLRKALDQLRQSLTPDGISDGQLLRSFIAERDEAAFSALVRRHGPMVLGVCQRILRNSHDADDAFQATFLVLVQKASAVLNKQALASWLYTVAHRSALEVQIRNMRRQKRERQAAMHLEVTPPEPMDWDRDERLLPGVCAEGYNSVSRHLLKKLVSARAIASRNFAAPGPR
jgi:RNA polymerase sigma factor (sigma-70 family)